MSKKHYIELADMVRRNGTFTPEQIGSLADFCHRQNPHFKRDRWLEYIAGKCGPNGGAVKK